MSLTTWKEEFYPIPADKAKGDALTAVDHSLKKWEGLRADNMKRHGCYAAGSAISDDLLDVVTDDGTMLLNCETCALCKYKDSLDDERTYCDKCPITLATGSPCDDLYADDDGDEAAVIPWDEWTARQNPEPMIAVLETTRKWLLGQLDEHNERPEER